MDRQQLPPGTEIAQYRITDFIGAGAKGQVYQATKQNQKFALKVLSGFDSDQSEQAILFNRETTFAARLNHPSLVKIFDFGRFENFHFIAMELVEGITLEEKLKQGPLDVDFVLKLATNLCSALHEVHGLGLVHRDIKPENVIVGTDNVIKLIDFGLAEVIDELAEKQSNIETVGTFQYSSPEQLGVLQKVVDGRADLYSLGVILFQCLTGKLPFDSSSLGTLFSQMKSQKASSIRYFRPEITPLIAEMTAKLLELDPNHRYQSAAGLLADLKNWKDLEAKSLTSKDSVLGQHDLHHGGLQRLPLLGREKELRFLREHLKEALEGNGRGVILEGDGGLGKSRLAKEIRLDATTRKIPVLAGKCSSQEINVPFSVIRQVIDQYLAKIRHMPEDQQKLHYNHIRTAAKDSPMAVAILNGGLKSILGIASVSDAQLDPELFKSGIKYFFCNLANLHQGLLLLIDDVQWIDPASREILKQIHNDIHQNRLMILMTSRNDSVSLEALKNFVSTIDSKELLRLSLHPLDLKATVEIAKAYLGGHEVDSNISDKLFTISSGNPFVLIENLGALVSSGHLKFMDQRWQLANLDFSKLGLSKNVYELVLERIERLPADVQSLLKTASAAGTTFHVQFLAEVTNQAPEKIRDQLTVAIRSNILDSSEDFGFQFIHDRVREALLTTLDPASLRKIYHRMAQVLGQIQDLRADQIFNLARYSHLGLIGADTTLAFRSNLAAGQLSIESNVYEQALHYLKIAGECEPAADVELSDRVQFFMDYGLACIERGLLNEGYVSFDRAIATAHDPFQKLTARAHKAAALFQDAKIVESWEMYSKILADCGQKIPKSSIAIILHLEISLLKHAWLNLRMSIPFLRPKLSPERIRILKLCAKIYQSTTVQASYSGKVLEIPLMVSYWHYLCRQLGPSPELVRSYAFLASFWAVLKKRKLMNNYLQKLSTMADQLNDPYAQLIAQVANAMSWERIGDDIEAERKYSASMPRLEKYLGGLDFGVAWGCFALFYFARGRTQESVQLIVKNMPRSDATTRRAGSVNQRFMYFLQLIQQGRLEEAKPVWQYLLDHQGHFGRDFKMISAQFPAARFVEMYETDALDSTVNTWIEDYKSYKYSFIYHDVYYAYIGYIRLRQYDLATTDAEKKAAKQTLLAELQFLNKILKFPFSRVHNLIQSAALMRIEGRFEKAKHHLQAAEKMAQTSISEFASFMILKEKARLALAEQTDAEASQFARLAYDFAQARKWPLRAKQVQKEFSLEVRDLAAIPNEEKAQPTKAVNDEGRDRITNTLLRISLASSFEMDPRKQISFSLDEIVKVMGAERSYVFLATDSSQELQFAGGRDNLMHDLQEPTGYSSTVVKKVAADGKALIVMGNDQMEALGSESAVVHGLRSILAAPLLLKGELKGVVYIDSSVAKNLFSQGDADLLSAIANHIAISFENLRMMNVEASRREMQKDLELSATIQKMLFPKEKDLELNGIRIAGFNRPAIQCGGDWWWHELAEQKKFRLFVGDVTGHGAGPAMITSFVAACFRFSQVDKAEFSLPDLLKKIGELLAELTSGEFLVSSVALEIDLENKVLHCWNSGSPGIYLFRQDGTKENFGAPGSMLGSSEFSVERVEVQLQPGDRIFIPTDGVMEMPIPEGGSFGIRRTLKMLDKTRAMDVHKGMQSMVDELDGLRKALPQDDDITMIYLEIT